jgi:hypothetical protein
MWDAFTDDALGGLRGEGVLVITFRGFSEAIRRGKGEKEVRKRRDPWMNAAASRNPRTVP